MARVLDPHVRGTTFSRTFTLSTGWTGATFTGGVIFTLRTALPGVGSVADDLTDANVTAQATSAAGDITFSGQTGTITISAADTKTWPVQKLYWDLEGTISGSPGVVHQIDTGTIRITADMTRSN